MCSRVCTGDSEQDRKRARHDDTSLQVTIINPGSGREGDELVEFVKQNAALVLAPSFSAAAFDELVEISPSAAGYHKRKRRATLQSTTLDKMVGDSAGFDGDTLDNVEEGGDGFGDVVAAARDAAAGPHGRVINDFFNINKGECDEGENKDDPFHVDNPSEPEHNTGRVIFQKSEEGRLASLRVRRGGAEVEVIVQRGCGIYCTVTLLAQLHAHGCNGRSLSHVIEVSRPDMPRAPSQAGIAAASAAQPALPLRQAFGDWRPERFIGAKLKWGAGRGVGSTRRVVIQKLRGPKVGPGRRRAGMTRKHARAAVEKMSPEELQRLASEFMAELGALPARTPHASRARPTPPLCPRRHPPSFPRPPPARARLRPAERSNATDPGCAKGVHVLRHGPEKGKRLSMSSDERGAAPPPALRRAAPAARPF